MIFANGKLVAQGQQFSLEDVEVITAVLNIDANQEHRPGPLQAEIYFGLNPDRNLTAEYDLCSETKKVTSNDIASS
jgi:galactose mutarotase-like enzyme